MTNNQEQWEKEFDEFMDRLPKRVGETPRELLRGFIRIQKALSKAEVIKEIEGLKEDITSSLVYLADGFPLERQWEVAEAHTEIIIKLIKDKTTDKLDKLEAELKEIKE